MKQRSLFPLLTAAALLLAAAAYGTVWLWESVRHRMTTAVCSRSVWEESLPLSGAVLRRETVLTTGCARVLLLGAEGERFPAGAPVAVAFDDPAEAFRALLLLRLEKEESQTLSPGSRGARLREYAAALARGEQEALASASRGLAAAVLEESVFSPETLRAEADALRAAGAAHALVHAPESGFFSAFTDGLETLSPVHARTLSARAFRERMEAPGDVSEAFGRLVTGSEWAFCAVLPLAEAGRFSPEQTVTLRLPDGGECEAMVRALNESGGEALLVLESRAALSRTLSLRRTELTAVLSRWEGYALPASSIREEDGRAFVRRAGVPLAEDIPVTVLCRWGDRVLVSSDGLRDGMEVSLLPNG